MAITAPVKDGVLEYEYTDNSKKQKTMYLDYRFRVKIY